MAIRNFVDSGKPMQGMCEDIATGIKERTARAVDYKGAGFVPLKPNYRAWKIKFGKRGIPDMNLMGDMMASMAVGLESPRHGRIYFKSMSQSKPRGGTAKIKTDLLANVHHFGRTSIKMPARPFMNVSESEVKKLKKKHYDDAVTEIIRSKAGEAFGEPGTR